MRDGTLKVSCFGGAAIVVVIRNVAVISWQSKLFFPSFSKEPRKGSQGDIHSFENIFFKDFICLFLDREGGREREREGKKHQCVVASHPFPPHWGPGLQPRHVP